jgi:glutamate dehydrogenase (NAD(P)+)
MPLCARGDPEGTRQNIFQYHMAIQGFGNVGGHIARLIAERRGKIVAVADHGGGISNKNGLNIPQLIANVNENTSRSVKGFPEAEPFEGSEVITWDADVLIPAALESVITKRNAKDVRATIIVEEANSPTTPEADEILYMKGILIIPDILANAGGVAVSYFEWAQNIQKFRWELERVTEELSKTMRKAYASVREVAAEQKIDFRTAAYMLAITRVGKAAVSRHDSIKGVKF